VAEWIEQNHSDNLDSYFTLLAHHWTQAAEMPEAAGSDLAIGKAVNYLEKAGDQAMQNYANAEAIQFLTQALDWDSKLPTPPTMEAAWQRNVRRARWNSRVGLAYYGLGSLPDCDRHVREALRLLGSPLPKTSTQFALGLFPQILRQVLHRYFPSRYVGYAKGKDREAAVEVARLYELMSRIYFYSNETLPIVYTAIRFLNEAEKAGTSPELASAYSSMGVLSGFVQLHKLAETYVERGIAVSEEVNQLSNRITVGVVTSAYKLTVGKWEEVRERVEESKALCERIGDYRQWGDCTAMLGESAFISGDLEYSLKIQKELLEDARRRRSPLHQCWGLLGVAVNNIRLGNEADAIPMLEEALRILEDTPNLASAIETNGQLALACLMTGQEGKALEVADKALGMATGISPTVYSMDVGYAAIAEVYFELWEKSLQKPDGKLDAAQLKSRAEGALKLLQAFKKGFPIGQPSLLYFMGWYEWLNGKRPKAAKLWRDGLESAKKFRMRHEEGLLRMKLGLAHSSDPSLRREHFDEAIRIFGEMDAVPMLRRVRELSDRK